MHPHLQITKAQARLKPQPERIRNVAKIPENGFTKSEELKAWCEALPEETRQPIAAAIAIRSANRVMPYLYRLWPLSEKISNKQQLLLAFRGNFVSQVAGTWPTRETKASAASVCATYASEYSYAESYAADFAAATYASSATYAAASAASAASASGSYASDAHYAVAQAAEAASANAAVIWENITIDANKISDGLTPFDLLHLPLWATAPRAEWTTTYAAFKTHLKSLSPNWMWWSDWYDSVVEGQPAFNLPPALAKDLSLRIALGGNTETYNEDFWNRDPDAINAEITGWLKEARIEAAQEVSAPADFTQRPSSHTYDFDGGKFVGRPVYAQATGQLASDMRHDIARKAAEAAEILRQSQSPLRFPKTMDRIVEFLQSIKDDRPALGKLLMLCRSLEADIAAINAPEMRRLFQVDVLSSVNDVQSSLDDYKAQFPEIMKAEAQRLALKLAVNDAEKVQEHLNDLSDAASQSAIVAASAVVALNDAKDKIEELTIVIAQSKNDQEVAAAIIICAELVGQRTTGTLNFVNRAIVEFGRRTASNIGKGYDKGVEGTTEGLVKGGIAVLVSMIAGPFAGIAVLIPMLKPFSRRADEIKERTLQPDDVEEA